MTYKDCLRRNRRFEQFEQRLVMSANALTDHSLRIPDVAIEPVQQVELASTLEETHMQTGVSDVRDGYGFDGTGQTVAIIDTGIAWDHYALGGGYGEDSRVVGGFDFAENDTNPYDDGPAGFHGTHVAGIVGSSDAINRGVAPGVDLVALRVIDDTGEGNIEWVEQALQWVHENKNSFANPITTVNLSLGMEWNSSSIPDWATLENELAHLEMDGLFISVAAGNSFQDFNTPGLSYPAASPFVVPVASTDSEGRLSDFSQRDSRVIAAPGEDIRSTVPGHLFSSGQSTSFLGSTGTSMAAPFVAGASALLRQANQFMGQENIDQDLLYRQFRETADQIYDQATGGYYYRINVAAAIEAVVADDYADSYFDATDSGVLINGNEISGTIGKLSDIDTFAFTAQRNGTATLTLQTTEDFNAFVGVQDDSSSFENNRVTIEVVAGREYKFKIGSDAGIGHYRVEFGFEESPSINTIDLGSYKSKRFPSQNVVGQQWYQLTAANDGVLTLVANANSSQSRFDIKIFDSEMNEIGSNSSTGGRSRLDLISMKGQDYYVKVIAATADIEFELTNLVSLRRGRLVVEGTVGDDELKLSAGELLLIDVNGTKYQFNSSNFDSVTIMGNGGSDAIDIGLSNRDDDVTMTPRVIQARSGSTELLAVGFESIHVNGGGGTDRISMFDSLGDDEFRNTADQVFLASSSYANSATGFSHVVVDSTGGYDTARINGGTGSDTFVSKDGRDYLRFEGTEIVAQNFDRVVADGGGGRDVATIYGRTGTNRFELNQSFAAVFSDNFILSARSFERINANAMSTYDTLVMTDSMGDDNLFQRGQRTILRGGSYLQNASGFQAIQAIASGGNDTAVLYDTDKNDTLIANSSWTKISSNSSYVMVEGFDRVNVHATNGGFDSAWMYGTNGRDFVVGKTGSTTIKDANGVISRAIGFESVRVDARGGEDFAFASGSTLNEVFTARRDYVEFKTVLQELRIRNVENSRFQGNGGLDEVVFANFEELDLLTAMGDSANAYLNNRRIVASDFDVLRAITDADVTSIYDIHAVDFLFTLEGNWQEP